jgi:hypothetical protein
MDRAQEQESSPNPPFFIFFRTTNPIMKTLFELWRGGGGMAPAPTNLFHYMVLDVPEMQNQAPASPFQFMLMCQNNSRHVVVVLEFQLFLSFSSSSSGQYSFSWLVMTYEYYYYI